MEDSKEAPQRELAHAQLGSGSVSIVVRDGETVCRPTGPWTPAVHALLNHLEQIGFDGSPRVLGFSEDGREILTYLDGEAAMRPWPKCLCNDVGIEALGAWLRDYHHAVRGFAPAPNAKWRVPGAIWSPGMIIRHGDLGPWNTIWREEKLVGVIDWDFAEPGLPIEDVAQMAWYSVPLRQTRAHEEAEIESEEDQHRRFRLLCESYGTHPGSVIGALLELQRKEIERIVQYGGSGLAPW